MIFYFASSTYQQVISAAIKESDRVLVGQESGQDVYFLKYIKEKQNAFTTLDYLILDINCCEDTDEELLEALDILKIINDRMRIIILAANRYAGDYFLTKCFQMGIYDLIATDDFLEIKQELQYSLIYGKKYGDSLQFKDVHSDDRQAVREEEKQEVNRVMVAVAGASGRIGVTHNCIVLANYLRKRGYMVAIVEVNPSHDLWKIQNFYEEKTFDGLYFSMKGIDYYPDADINKLGAVLGKTYNFIIADFGRYSECDRITFNKAEIKILICGSKPWEIDDVNSIFALADEETLQKYNFCFSFTDKGYEKEIREGMGSIDHNSIFFVPIQGNPFQEYEFVGAGVMLEKYLPLKRASPKKRFFRREKKENEKKKNSV